MPTYRVIYRPNHLRRTETVVADEVDHQGGGQITFWRYQLVVGRPRVVTALRVSVHDITGYEIAGHEIAGYEITGHEQLHPGDPAPDVDPATIPAPRA